MMLVPQITTAAAGVATTTTRGAIDAQWRVVYYVRYVSTTMSSIAGCINECFSSHPKRGNLQR